MLHCFVCVMLQSFVCGEMSWLVGSFFMQSCLKYFLTEGEFLYVACFVNQVFRGQLLFSLTP